MDIEDLLKEFKNIQADPEYTRRSRRFIIKSAQTPRAEFSLSRILFDSFQVGSSIILTGIVIVLLLNGFSVGRLLTPFRLSSLNPESLKAEAEAVDIQIELLNLDYQESELDLAAQTTTPAFPPSLKSKARPSPRPPAASRTESVTLDEALDLLSQ